MEVDELHLEMFAGSCLALEVLLREAGQDGSANFMQYQARSVQDKWWPTRDINDGFLSWWLASSYVTRAVLATIAASLMCVPMGIVRTEQGYVANFMYTMLLAAVCMIAPTILVWLRGLLYRCGACMERRRPASMKQPARRTKPTKLAAVKEEVEKEVAPTKKELELTAANGTAQQLCVCNIPLSIRGRHMFRLYMRLFNVVRTRYFVPAWVQQQNAEWFTKPGNKSD